MTKELVCSLLVLNGAQAKLNTTVTNYNYGPAPQCNRAGIVGTS